MSSYEEDNIWHLQTQSSIWMPSNRQELAEHLKVLNKNEGAYRVLNKWRYIYIDIQLQSKIILHPLYISYLRIKL